MACASIIMPVYYVLMVELNIILITAVVVASNAKVVAYQTIVALWKEV